MGEINLLLACWDEVSDVAIAKLGPEFRITVVHTLKEAEQRLAEQAYDLVVVTLRFDESRATDLIPVAVRCQVPIALVRFGISHLPAEFIARSFIACRALGCVACIDLTALTIELGPEAALAQLRIALRSAVHRVSRF